MVKRPGAAIQYNISALMMDCLLSSCIEICWSPRRPLITTERCGCVFSLLLSSWSKHWLFGESRHTLRQGLTLKAKWPRPCIPDQPLLLPKTRAANWAGVAPSRLQQDCMQQDYGTNSVFQISLAKVFSLGQERGNTEKKLRRIRRK